MHGSYRELIIPIADVIVCCGDMTPRGKLDDAKDFLMWFADLPHKYKIFISGNHDFLFEKYKYEAEKIIPDNIIYLEDSEVEIMGLKFYGTPVTPIFFNWAFNRTEDVLKSHWEKIPNNIDILITHGPPYGIMDLSKRDKINTGSPSLYEEVINRIKPTYHVFGHIHEGYGILEKDGITFINASNMDVDYNLVNEPIVIEIDKNTK